MAGPTVTVACKIPNGLFLRIFDFAEHSEPVMGGGTQTVKRAVQKGAQIKVNGPAVPFGKVPDFMQAGGYALTPGIDKEFFDKWLEQNADLDAVRNRLVFASEKAETTIKRAEDGASILSGLHPINPDKDARIPRGSPNLSPLTKADVA